MQEFCAKTLWISICIHNIFRRAVCLTYAYISVEQMGEEDDQEELNRCVDPYVSSCHCMQCKVQIYIYIYIYIYIMASSDF